MAGATAIGGAGLAMAAALCPKDMTYAADSRLAMASLFLASTTTAVVAAEHGVSAWLDRRILQRHARSSRPLQDTTRFLVNERRLARSYRGWLLGGTGIAATAAVLTAWPQLSTDPQTHRLCAGALWACMFFCCLHLIAGGHYRRNVRFLRKLLRAQERHVHWAPPRHRLYGQGANRLTFHDLQQGGALIVGQSGSGKTSAVGAALLDQLLSGEADQLPPSGVILDPQGSYVSHIRALAAKHGRDQDLFVLTLDAAPGAFGTADAIIKNPLDTTLSAGELAALLVSVQQLAGGVKSQDSFFSDAARIFMKHAIVLLWAGLGQQATLHHIGELAREGTDETPFYDDLLRRIIPGAGPVADEIEAALSYFEGDYRRMGDRQRSGLVSTITNLLDDFSGADVTALITGRSTLTVDTLLDEGKLLYVHLPLAARPRVARVLSSLIKLELQKAVLKRIGKERPSFLYADEFQALYLAGQNGDAEFFDRCRASRHANVVICQNLSSLLRLTTNRNDVLNCLGNLAVKIFLRNTEPETIEYASKLFGEQSQIAVSISEPSRGAWGKARTSYSWSAKTTRVVTPERFAELAIPEPGNPSRHFADSVMHVASRAEAQRMDMTWPIHRLPA